MFSDGKRIAFLSAILVFSIALLGTSLAVIFLELNVVNAFVDFEVQESKSSLAEWRWISLNPTNVDTGPTNAIFTAAAFGLLAAVTASAWATILSCRLFRKKTRILGIVSFCLTTLSAIPCLAVLTFVFVNQGVSHVAKSTWEWDEGPAMTQETYLCVAFPSQLDPEIEKHTYGYPVCRHAKLARHLLIPIFILSTLIALLNGFHLLLEYRTVREERLAARRQTKSSQPVRQRKRPQPTEPGAMPAIAEA